MKFRVSFVGTSELYGSLKTENKVEQLLLVCSSIAQMSEEPETIR